MSVFYYILWIPSYEISEPEIIHKDLDLCKLQDVEEEDPLYIKGHIQANFDITIDYGINDKECPKSLLFKLLKKDEYGFLTYSLTLPNNPQDWLLKDLHEHMHPSIYHYIKGFFHEHIYHDEEEDSLLRPFKTGKKVDWDKPEFRVQVFDHYLDSYILKYQGHTKEHIKQLHKIRSNIHKKTDISKNIHNLHYLVIGSRNIQAEARYSKSLKRCYAADSQSDKIKLLDKACKDFEEVVDELLFWRNHFTSIISFIEGHASLKWGRWGFMMGLASILLTLYLQCSNHSNSTNNYSCNATTNETIQKTECISNDVKENQNLIPKQSSTLDPTNSH